MAQQIQTLFIDDIDGGPAQATVRFGLDGTDYEIDLSTAHNEELHKVLAGYLTHARKAAGTARRGSRGRRPADPFDTRKVREWAKGQGIDIKERGRVPAEVIEKYQAAGV
jgi:hypothetical protein